ncbi:FAD-binding protein [Yinghuangia aomiensis]
MAAHRVQRRLHRAWRSSAHWSAGRAELAVPILDTVYITRLLVRDNVVFGAYGFDLADGSRYVIHADAVILATGGTPGSGGTSSRRDENTGDTFRLAVLAGARIRDPELVQFHPSGLVEPEDVAEDPGLGGCTR